MGAMITQAESEQLVANATRPLLEKIQQLTGALDEAKAVIRSFKTQIFGVRAETSQVLFTDEHQIFIDPTWGAGHETTPPPPPVVEVEVTTVRKPRDHRGLAQKYPHLAVKDAEVPVAPEIQAQVDAGQVSLRRTGTYHDELVKPDSSAFIRRVYDLEVVQPLTGTVTLQLPQADRVVPGGILADESIDHLVITKYLDAMPFHRQLLAWRREQVEVSRKTVNDAFIAWDELHAPLAAVIREQIFDAPVVHADESWARVQAKGVCERGNLWTLVGAGQVAYAYTPDRIHARALEIIPRQFTGNLVVDAWEGWFDVTWVELYLCNAHARRPFAAFLKRNPSSADARTMVDLYRNLYRLEGQAKEGPAEGVLERLREIRATQAQKVMDTIKKTAESLAAKYPDQHTLAKGARYILGHEPYLTKFLTNPLVPPDNNLAENALRINALIRKNSMFFGTHEAGNASARVMTILHSCRMIDLEPHRYLQHVRPFLLLHRRGRPQNLEALTPRVIAAAIKDPPPS